MFRRLVLASLPIGFLVVLGSPSVVLGLFALVTAALCFSCMDALCEWVLRQVVKRKFPLPKLHCPSQLWMTGIGLAMLLFAIGLFWEQDRSDTISATMFSIFPLALIIAAHLACLVLLALFVGLASRAADLTVTEPRARRR
ncbi:MAG: hypothetical protein K2Z81_27950 [Cyanobacteria bacterium]|nr:hypothetical protein [Cyanobacteriota bacterium]